MENIGKYKVYDNQSWLDISNHLYGTVEYAYSLAFINEASISDKIPTGSVINYEKDKPSIRLILLSMSENKSIPATAITASTGVVPQLEGISYWAIGYDFKIS